MFSWFCAYENWQTSTETLNVVRQYHSTYAREPDYGQYKKKHHEIITEIQSRLKKGGKCLRLEFTGSAYEGLQIGPDIEFDVMVVLDGSGITCKEIFPGYAKLVATQSYLSSIIGREKKQKQFLDSDDDVIRPYKTMNIFKGTLQRIINESYFQYNVLLKDHGPAIQMDVYSRDGFSRVYSVDVVPAFEVSGNLYVAKPGIDESIPNDDTFSVQDLWRRSTSLKEKERFVGIDRGSGCRKQILRILKAFIQNDPQFRCLTSYHIKTALLHKTYEENSWHESELAKRLIDMLVFLENSFQKKNLPHYFIRNVNLYRSMSDIQLDNLYRRMKRIRENKHIFLKTFGGSHILECQGDTDTDSNASAKGSCIVQ